MKTNTPLKAYIRVREDLKERDASSLEKSYRNYITVAEKDLRMRQDAIFFKTCLYHLNLAKERQTVA